MSLCALDALLRLAVLKEGYLLEVQRKGPSAIPAVVSEGHVSTGV